MRSIKGIDTQIELIIRKELFRRGYRYRINYKKLAGKPDIVFVSKKIAIFCDSEFWHGRNWEDKKAKIKNNQSYWIPKIERNIERDKLITRQLEQTGWTVLRFWDSDIKIGLNNCIDKIIEFLR